MKKTVKINIGGAIYLIDEDAYLRLKNYLNKIERHFATEQEGKEIVADIENRIAELFQELTGKIKEVVTLDDVNHVIEQMGEPEQFSADGTVNNTHPENQNLPMVQAPRRLYRDPQNRVLGGVCAGLGIYFNTDPLVFRLIFIIALLFFGSALLVYVLMWIIVPEARTTTQRLEMHGKRVNISTIQYSVKSEYNNVRESWSNKKTDK